MRRFLYAAILVIPQAYGESSTTFVYQCQALIVLNLWYCWNIAKQQPYEDREANKAHMFNEFVNLCISVAMMLLGNVSTPA